MLQRYFRKLWTWYLFFYYLLHMKMKKMLLGAFFGMFALAGIAVLPNSVSATWGTVDDPDGEGARTTQERWAPEWSITKQQTSYNPDVYGKDSFQNDNLIKTIQSAINWVLGILSFIALALCLWGGFQMMTSWGDQKKYESGLNLLKWAAIGLAVIAVSWLVVSLVFYVINGAVNADGTGNGEEIIVENK